MTPQRLWRVGCVAVALGLAACDGAREGRTEAPGVPVGELAAGGAASFASFSHTCAVVGGGLQCWGAASEAQIGDGVLARRSPHPVRVVEAGGGVTAAAAGGVHTCAVVNAEALCWGSNVWGQVGARPPFIATAPRRVDGLPRPVERVAAGAHHTCATSGGDLWCWGKNGEGQAGVPPCPKRALPAKCISEPARVQGLPGEVTALALGRGHSCAVIRGDVHCWGANERGQLGDGSAASRWAPAPVRGLPAGVSALAAGRAHTCALAAGEVWCWGANEHGQLGDGSLEDRLEAVASSGLPRGLAALAAGAAHTCAASARGVHCWGDGREGQLGGGPRDASVPLPVPVAGLAGEVHALAAGADHTCAAQTAGRVACWGDNDFGQLGSGDAPADHAGPVRPAPWDDGGLRDRDGDGRFTVACLGDSNTQSTSALPRTWCERLGELAPAARWKTVNRGEGGATAVAFRSMILADDHLAYALESDSVDAVVLAYGTNDLLFAKAEPAQVAEAYGSLRRRARSAGVEAFAALAPPIQPAEQAVNARIAELNALLAELFPPSRVVDFWSDMRPEDYFDAVHLGASGQARRARAAWETLSAAATTDAAEAP